MRPITLFTGQWTDLPLETLAQKASSWGYQGFELACHPNHFDIEKAVNDPTYCNSVKNLLGKYDLKSWTISNHLEGQVVCDHNDSRSDPFVPPKLRGRHSEKNAWGAERIKMTAVAAKNFGVKTVAGFTGSSVWHLLYFFPPVSKEMVDAGFREFAEKWLPILDEYKKLGIRFALEVHPSEIAYDFYTAERALKALDGHESFGFNFDPSHLQWQFVNPVEFLYEFRDRIFNVHIKDVKMNLTGRSSILSSHFAFGDRRRGWDFRSPGRGDIDFEGIVRALEDIKYSGPLSIEWEDSSMDREWGAKDALTFLKTLNYPRSERAFDDAYLGK
jgi:sugar phosphate isomerase/epimerase